MQLCVLLINVVIVMKNKKIDLENLPRENIFIVPENYFENLSSRIQAETSSQTRVIPLISWSKKRTWASMAACSAIIILGYFTLMPKQNSLGNEALSGVQNHEIVNYLIQENLNQGDLAEQFDNNKSIKIKDYELLENLKVSNKDILRSIDLEHIEEDI